MNRTTLAAFFAAFAISTTPAFAHHPFSADYDWKKPVTLTGTVTKIEWANPHAMMTIDGKDDHNVSGTWTVELGNTGVLQHHGWNQTTLKVGDKISIDGWAANDGTKRVNAMFVKMPNGHDMFAGSSFFQMASEASATKPAGTTGSSQQKR